MSETENSVLIHHLTDLHIGPLHTRPTHPSYLDIDDAASVERYIRFLRIYKRRPDLLVISGDLTSSATEPEFAKFGTLLDQITGLLYASARERDSEIEPRICIVPGNHDLDWTQSEQTAKESRFANLCRGRPEVLTPLSGKHYVHYQQHNLLVWAFDSCALGGVKDPTILRLVDGLGAVMKKLAAVRPESDGDDWGKLLGELNALSRQDPGYIRERDLEALDQLASVDYDSVFKIAVMHHNPSLVPGQDIDRYQTILNGGIVKDRLLRKGFDLIFHGHRHFPHCSYEEYLEDQRVQGQRSARTYRNGIYTLSGPSLGSHQSDARWYAIEIEASANVYEDCPPSSLVTVSSATESGSTYELNPTYRIVIGKKVHSQFRLLHEWLGRDPKKEHRDQLRPSMESIQLALLHLQGKTDDWEENGWQTNFDDELKTYSFIYGTDRLGPASWCNPTYLGYQAHQFAERQRRMKARSGRAPTLSFSQEVLRAIKRTKWLPDDGVKLARRSSGSNELEIARILIWDARFLAERSVLRMIDSYHKLFGVPVFVIGPEFVAENGDEEFVVALDKQANPLRCYKFDLEKGGDTTNVPAKLRNKYKVFFLSLLENQNLRCISSILGDHASHEG